jgi:hypothetical protein
MPSLHRKTAKGSTEIETRAHRLPPRLRTVLLMVDGKRNDDELVALLGGSTAETLAALADQGFIESVGADAAAPAPAAAAAAGAAKPGDTEPAAFVVAAATDLAAAKRDAVRALSELLGPAADSISVRMEKAASFEELHGLVQRAAQLIAGMRGRALAEAYWMRFGPRG